MRISEQLTKIMNEIPNSDRPTNPDGLLVTAQEAKRWRKALTDIALRIPKGQKARDPLVRAIDALVGVVAISNQVNFDGTGDATNEERRFQLENLQKAHAHVREAATLIRQVEGKSRKGVALPVWFSGVRGNLETVIKNIGDVRTIARLKVIAADIHEITRSVDAAIILMSGPKNPALISTLTAIGDELERAEKLCRSGRDTRREVIRILRESISALGEV